MTIDLALDGSGRGEARTGVPFLDHMLESFARHGFFDLTIKAAGDLHIDDHHTVEDVGIVLGRAFREALGDRSGIKRFATGRGGLHCDCRYQRAFVSRLQRADQPGESGQFSDRAGPRLHEGDD